MNNKNDGSNKDNPRGNDPAGAKRPHAVIDLKATEVERKDAKVEAPAAAPSAPSPAAAKPANPVPPASKPSDPLTAAAKSSEAKPADTKTEMPKPDIKYGESAKPEAAKAAGSASPGLKSQGFEQPKNKPASSTGTYVGSMLSHLTAGALGALLALVGAEAFAPQLTQTIGWPKAPAGTSEVVTRLQDRLAALEKRAPAEAAPNQDLVKKIAALEARAQEVEALSASVKNLVQTQAQLTADAKAASDKLAKLGATESEGARVAAIEERLAVMASAAGDPEKGGRVPQLAAITGKLADLETTLQTQLAQMRANIPQQVEKGLSEVTAASEAAKSGASRIDRDLAGVKTDVGRLTQRAESLKADGDRLSQSIRTAQEEAGSIRSALDALKGDIEAKLKATAKTADVAAAVAPVTAKLGALEQSLDGVVKSEEDRKTNAERIVVSLELGNLKRVLDRGQPYAAELAEVSKAAGGKVDLAPLERYKNNGVPTIADLATEFRDVAHAVIDADSEPADATIMDRLLAGAKSVVRVRKVNHTSDDKSTEAVVARMEEALKDGRLDDVLSGAKQVPQKASAPMQSWLGKVEARNTVDRAIAGIEGQLKASLSGAPATKASN